MIKIKSFVFNPFQENTYVLYDESDSAIIMDPGCSNKQEEQTLKAWIESHELNVKAVYNTHCHIDHVLGNDFCKRTFNVDLIIPKGEKTVYAAVKSYSFNYGIPNYTEAEVDEFIDEQDQIRFGDSLLDIFHIPGHAPGHLVFFNAPEKICIGGDVLFKGSIGRTDLPGGNHEQLLSSIKNILFTLDDDMVVYPGHGPETTIGEEKRHNPFVGENAY